MSDVVRVAPLLRACMEVLSESEAPLAVSEVLQRVKERLELTSYELEPYDDSGQPRWENHLRWHSGDLATVGWMSKRDGLWSLTEAGATALEDYDDDQLIAEKSRLYNDIRKRREHAVETLGSHEQLIARVLSLTNPGSWTGYSDIAAITAVSADTVAHFLAGGKKRKPGAYRVLRDDGSLPPDGMLHAGYRGMDRAKTLRSEGIEFDEHGRASQAQRITADDFRERLAELENGEGESPPQRAWLVRGSSVDGRDLVPVWLHKDSVSLAATRLRAITPPVSRPELKSYVDADYSDKSYAAREAKVAEFDNFVNRMRPGDYVLTTTGGKAYVGEITGNAEYIQSSDERSNIRRRARWLNSTNPVPFNNLPTPLPAKFHSQSDVLELTEDIGAVEELLAQLGIARADEAPDVRRKLEFPGITDKLAKDLLVDRPWLQRQADLLWDRKQLIFYGPPGTGKTYIADKLASHLTEPSAIKLVQFHPSYTYEDFFEGFRPTPSDSGQLSFELKRGPFRQLVEAAREHPADPHILIIDEINRGNLAKVFGELYFVLEYRDHAISLLYSGEDGFVLPPNVFIIGTMNTTDRSIALVDAAMRRRFAFVELHPNKPPTEGLLAEWLDRQEYVQYNADTPQLLDALNARIQDRNFAIGPSYFMRPEIYRREDGLELVWETSILPLLEEYHYGSPPEVMNKYQLAALRKTIAASTGEEGEL